MCLFQALCQLGKSVSIKLQNEAYNAVSSAKFPTALIGTEYCAEPGQKTVQRQSPHC